MITFKDVEKLAELSRIELSEKEKESLARDMDKILEYVGQIQDVYSASKESFPGPKNVLREDDDFHESGIYKEKLLNSAPHRQGDFIRVKKIL